jgi:DNA polymerase III alpha subunit
MADLISTDQAIKLLLVADQAELVALEKSGWFKRRASDQWNTVEIVKGRIKQLKDFAEVATTPRMTDLVGVGNERLEQLVRKGWFKKLGYNRWSISEVVKGFIKYKNDADRRTSKSAVASRVSTARAQEIELRIAQRSGELCETDEAVALVDDVIGTLKADLMSLPATVTRDLKLRADIEKAVNDILNRTSRRLGLQAQNLRVDGEVAVRPIVPASH